MSRAAKLVQAGPEMRALLQKREDQHKYDHGHVLVLTGGAGRTGAARLSARAALRIGAGLVTLGVPGAAQFEVAAQITALMLTRVEGGEDLAARLEDPRLNALCVGPGLGIARAQALVPVALAAGRATLLDADALTAFEEAPDRLFEALHPAAVLTPRDGEFARLFPDLSDAARQGGDARLGAVRDAAERSGAVVLLKGARTLVAEPGGAAREIDATGAQAAPWLATAGSGDVLSGLIAGLLARGLAPLDAAGIGAFLHGAAGRAFGPGLIAEDLPEAIPQVLAHLLRT